MGKKWQIAVGFNYLGFITGLSQAHISAALFHWPKWIQLSLTLYMTQGLCRSIARSEWSPQLFLFDSQHVACTKTQTPLHQLSVPGTTLIIIQGVHLESMCF